MFGPRNRPVFFVYEDFKNWTNDALMFVYKKRRENQHIIHIYYQSGLYADEMFNFVLYKKKTHPYPSINSLAKCTLY